MELLRDISLWLWRLIPANPILVRVVSAAGKRWRHFHARWIYLGILFLVITLQSTGLGRTNVSLADLAKESTQIFKWVSLVQLFLMAFIAPVFTAAAITQEKDANTYSILLTTPLSSGQIVLGSLLSRLYFVWVLLLSGLPIFAITMIYGGVTLREVFESFGLAAATGLVTGAMAITISVLAVGTRKTIFAFFVGIAVYLIAIGAYGLSAWGPLAESPQGALVSGRGMSWVAPLHPFLALLVVTGQTPAPAYSDVAHYGWPFAWLYARPQYGYMVITTLAAVAMILLSMFFVRAGAREGEATLLNRIKAFLAPQALGERRRKPRRVWSNPIAWREATTRASAGGRSIIRYVYLVAGVALAVLMLYAAMHGWWGIQPASVGEWVVALVWIELAVILLVVTNAAASSLTREKESMTMEILLSTPLTSRYIVAGMLQGLVRFALPLIAVPTITIVIFVVAGFARPASGANAILIESALVVPLQMIGVCAVAALVGLQFSLTARKTVQAVMWSTAVVMGGALLLWGCAQALFTGGGATVAAVTWPFSPFAAVASLIDVRSMFPPSTTPPGATEVATVRMVRVVMSFVSLAAYLGLAYYIYISLVRNYDMTVRRQSV
ncbi:MAG: ABC transporter permease [Phycisphaerae bacterium]